IICIGKIKEQYLKDAIDEYKKRLGKYCILILPIQIILICNIKSSTF
ncbi:MAG: 23S rRNA (pseudouridine(1915)-N(3))-methyltransferase RlmH, partial [Clostridia bacterium]|nr:23S rRNA (pseudouridine(1915)-N(3))-methyltransferase RlmH [Clostridia bacterium]